MLSDRSIPPSVTPMVPVASAAHGHTPHRDSGRGQQPEDQHTGSASPGWPRCDGVDSRRRTWHVPLTGAAAAAVTVALVATVLQPTPAYAVSGGDGAEITPEVNRLEGAEALQAELAERGVPADITYVPTVDTCRPGRYTDVDTPGLLITVRAHRFEVTIPAGAVRRGNTFVLSATVTPADGGVPAIVDFGIAQDAVAPCTVIDAS